MELLVLLARHRPVTEDDLRAIPRLPRSAPRHASTWLLAVQNGLAAPTDDLLEERPRERHHRSPAVADRIGRLRAWRDTAAPRLGLEPGLLLPQRLVVAVAEAAPQDVDQLAAVPGLRRWRVDAAGAEMLSVSRSDGRQS